MDTEKCKALLCTIETGSLSAAAEKLGYTPSGISRMWANVRRGEKANISPYKHKANYQFDSSFPYELAVMNETATKLFQSVPEGIERFEELKAVLPALQLFGVIDEKYVAPDAMEPAEQ